MMLRGTSRSLEGDNDKSDSWIVNLGFKMNCSNSRLEATAQKCTLFEDGVVRTGRQSLTLNNREPELKHINKVRRLSDDPFLDDVK